MSIVAKLNYIDGGAERDFALDPGRTSYSIGRNPMCDLRVNNPSVSRKHADIRLDAASGRYTVVDLGSSNGTFVNGARVQSHMLCDGDRIVCGEFPLVFVEQTSRSLTSASRSNALARIGGEKQNTKGTFNGLPADVEGTDPRPPSRSALLNRVSSVSGELGLPMLGGTGNEVTESASLSHLAVEIATSSESRPSTSASGSGLAWKSRTPLDSEADVRLELERVRSALNSAENRVRQLEAENKAIASERDAVLVQARDVADMLRRVATDVQSKVQNADTAFGRNGEGC